MKLWCGVLLSLLALNAVAKGKSGAKSRYPVVESVIGKAEQIEDVLSVENRQPKHSEKVKALKKGMTFKDKAQFRLDEKSQVRLALSPSSTLVLNEKTDVLLPSIAWKDGSVQQILLNKGSLRYICKSECDRKITSPLYEGVPPVGDYLFEYDPKIPQIQVSVIAGELAFRGLENEASVVLHAGESASFKGELENDVPAFDVLLKGRKVAKGKLSEVRKVPTEQFHSLVKQEEDLIKAQKKVPKPKRLPTQICDKPWGELNQCAWICENNKKGAKDCLVNQGAQCVRVRCNANGDWSDRTEIPASQSSCKAQSFVGVCNY